MMALCWRVSMRKLATCLSRGNDARGSLHALAWWPMTRVRFSPGAHRGFRESGTSSAHMRKEQI